ncbi:MAG: response regulator transcription factor [Candidatus Latescibacteria bacterium]|jgi:phosphoserine phosphatase RsbU/P|nr:response regulator transcription factor [Candidatus Latescibacterota bacterium]
MQILIAEDDPIARHLLDVTLRNWGYDVVVTEDGSQAWDVIQAPDRPALAILDWMMPGIDGINICRKIRERSELLGLYVLLLTTRGSKIDIIQGLDAGANDYLTKPFDPDELMARIKVGERVLGLQSELADRVSELEAALAHVRQLQGIIPICSYCKNIRDDLDSWHQLEKYIVDNSEAQFSHGICPDCYENVVKPELERTLPSARRGLSDKDNELEL